jgi:hypothetical protein
LYALITFLPHVLSALVGGVLGLLRVAWSARARNVNEA